MKYIKGLNGIRAISLFMVLTTHLGTFDDVPGDFFQTRVFNLFSGNAGVNIFFTLSGFLITRLLYMEKMTENTIGLKSFYIRRFLRLLPPLLLFYIVVAILMSFHAIPATYKGFLISFFYLYNFVFHGYYTQVLGHTWSLAVEEQFYIIWPFVLSFCSTIKSLIFALLLIFLCVVAWYIPNFNVGWAGHTHPFKSLYFFDRGFIPAAAPIMIGCIASIVCMEWQEKAATAVKNGTTVFIVCCGLYAAPIWLPEAALPLASMVQSLAVGIFITWLLFNQQSFICKLLEVKPLAYIGKISYGLYVYQGLFLTTGPNGNLAIQHYPLNLILTFICGVLSYELLEKRVLKYRNRFASNSANVYSSIKL